MHTSVMTWVAQVVQDYNIRGLPTLEIGSLNVNGSVRHLFEDERDDYIGLDMRMGPGVDIKANAHDLPFDGPMFEIVICCEMLEHDDRFWKTLDEVRRVLAVGGYFILTTRSNGFPYHEYPGDYYRFDIDVAPTLMEVAGCELVSAVKDPEAPGIFVLGRRDG